MTISKSLSSKIFLGDFQEVPKTEGPLWYFVWVKTKNLYHSTFCLKIKKVVFLESFFQEVITFWNLTPEFPQGGIRRSQGGMAIAQARKKLIRNFRERYSTTLRR